MLSFRPACADDADYLFGALRDLAKEQGVAHRFALTLASLRDAFFVRRLADVILALEEEQPAGLISFSNTHWNFTLFSQPGLYIHDLYVQPPYRRRGIGKRLIEEVVRVAKERGCGRVDFVALRDNQAALAFYHCLPQVRETDHLKHFRITC
jgi:ribosomal protein S18 acetylase RimI-like enzyme